MLEHVHALYVDQHMLYTAHECLPLSHHQGDVDRTDDVTLAQATPTGVAIEEVELCLCVGELADVITILDVLESQFTARNNTHTSPVYRGSSYPFYAMKLLLSEERRLSHVPHIIMLGLMLV